MIKELEYPFDAEYLLKKKKSIKRALLEQPVEYIKKRVAILGGSTTHEVRLMLELFLLNNGIMPEFYESEFNQYYQEGAFDNLKLKEFHPDIIYVYTTNYNIISYPDFLMDEVTIEKLLQNEIEKYYELWNKLEKDYQCPIIQNNFDLPTYRIVGNKSAADIHGRVNFISRLNNLFYEFAQRTKHFYICDLNYISAWYGLERWQDPFYWYMYKYAIAVPAIPYLAYNVANIIKSIFGKNKKGLVLDLDNTLWGGVIGDDGIDNIKIGVEEPEGQVYSDFQTYIKELKNQGILLNINSKNEYENAVMGLKHPDSVLKLEDFIVVKANWNTKDINMRAIADELNVLPESLVFVDDNPAEREIVKGCMPNISAPILEKPENYLRLIDQSGYFEMSNYSDEDFQRSKMYKENINRTEEQGKFLDYKDYLISLKMEADIRPFEKVYCARIAQLSNKSNQFNLTTKRYTQAEIENLAEDNQYITLYGRLKDKFGDEGIVTVIIGMIQEKKCHINLWLMSCRVLKRDMEYAMMDALEKHCVIHKIREIYGYYYPTQKNSMVRGFYADMGFTKVNEDDMGNTVWKYKVANTEEKRNTIISVNEICEV